MSEAKKKGTKAKKTKDVDTEPRRSGRKREIPERLIEDLSPKRKRAAPERRSKSPVSKKQKKTVKSSKSKSPAKKKTNVSSSESSSESESYSDSDTDKKSRKKKSAKKNAKKKGKTVMAVPSATLKKLKKEQHDALMALSVPDLKARLTANDQVSTGSKPELQLRIADCVVNGGFPRCPKCFGGKIKQSGDDAFYCPGSYEDDHFVRCSWTGVGSDIQRVPWKTDGKNDI